MYEIIKTVINSGRFELSDMLTKIDIIWLQRDITEGQRTELVELAREKAIPENSYAGVQRQLDTLFVNLAELTARVMALEGNTPDTQEYPEYMQPTGAHDAYHTGDRVTYNGRHYICQMDDCVWDPDTYPAGWQPAE